jgi:hypothetical protein
MMTNKSASLRFLLRMSLFALALFSVTALLSRCGENDNKNSATSGDFTYSYGGSFERGDGAALTAAAVNFTLSWSEDGDKITGLYHDDYFAQLSVQVTGVVRDGMRIMTIIFNEEKDGISKLSITTAAATGELGASLSISNLVALSVSGNQIFEKSGIVMSKNSSGGAAGGSAVFFSAVAGEYDFYAKNTNGVGNLTNWTHGSKYKLTVAADGTVTFATDGSALTYKFGGNADDVYEKYDHEEYAVLNPEPGLKILVQRHFDPATFGITWEAKDGAFWMFRADEPGALPGAFTEVGLDYIVGTHKYKITFISGENATDYAIGDAVEVTIAADGTVTGTFGEFKYDKNDSTANASTVNGKAEGNLTIYRPDSKTFPRWSLQLRFVEEKFAQATAVYEVQLGNSGRKAYNAVVGK